MPTATLTSKGQITIPKQVRDRLGVQAGDRLSFREREDGSIVVEAETVDLLALAGSVRPRARGVSVESMNEAVRKKAAGK